MKLRIRGNSLRWRMNRLELNQLAFGESLIDSVRFPGGSCFSYALKTHEKPAVEAHLEGSTMEICIPLALVQEWAGNQEVGLSFELPTGEECLKILIEKDLECLHGREEEHDPYAFPSEMRR